MATNKQKINTFEDLELWQLCRILRKEIYKVTKIFPEGEKYTLVTQLRRAAISSTANIAEGFGRYHYQENIQFCRLARGSLFEIIDHLITSYDENYIDENTFRELKELCYRCVKVLNGYIASIKKRSTR
jgi:four helix bundle protein